MASDYSQAFDRIGTSVGKIENHLDIKEEREYQCNMSSEAYGRRGNFQRHLMDEDANGITRDDQCFSGRTKEGNSNMDILAKYTSNEHTQNTIQKKYKRLGSSLQKNLNEFSTHNDTKPFQCAMCLEKFPHKFQLVNHIKNKYGDKNYKCSECSYQTNKKSTLEDHLNRHNGIKPFQCDICLKRFTQKDNLRSHIKNLHAKNGEKDYKCSDCFYQTNNKLLFNGHVLNKHKGIKPFECNICLMKFTLKNSLITHIKYQHTESANSKDHKCTECDYRTNVKGNLKAHIKTHAGVAVKSFNCDICMRQFSKEITFKQHIETKHTESEKTRKDEIYNCSECSYQTDIKYNLRQHRNTHIQSKPFHAKIDMYFGF